MSGLQMLRRQDVEKKTGLSKATVYRLVKERKFPQPIQLTERAVAWRSEEIDEWLESRPRAGGL